MKFLIVEGSSRSNKDTGEVVYYVRVMGEFLEFGERKHSTADIKVSSEKKQLEILEHKNKMVDLEILIPKSQYPLELA